MDGGKASAASEMSKNVLFGGISLTPPPPPLCTDAVSSKLQGNNIFTIAKRNVEGQDMLYQSLKLTNGIWVLAELRIQPGNTTFTVGSPFLLHLRSCRRPF